MRQRNEKIDFIRGVATLGVILIHTSYYFIGIAYVREVWNYSQFVVQAFVFCSAYLFFKKEFGLKTVGFSFEYFKKRFIRLLWPYYIFLLFFLPLVYFQNPRQIDVWYVIKSVFVWNGGVQIAWLVLLFLQLSLAAPLLFLSYKKNKALFAALQFIIVASGIALIFFKFPYNWRLIAWLPWSGVLLYAFYFVKFEKTKYFKIASLAAFLFMYIFLVFVFMQRNISLSLYSSKYPPNLYFIAYGVAATAALFYVFYAVPRQVLQAVNFFSIYAYPIFFIHYWFVIFLAPYLSRWGFTWWSFFGTVLAATVITQIGINKLAKSNIITKLKALS